MIYICVNNPDYYDEVRVLVKAFYPDRETTTKREEKTADFFEVTVEDGSVRILALAEGRKRDISFPCESTEKRLVKDMLKGYLYRLLRELTGKSLPWGMLTGVHPTKIAMKRLEEGAQPEDIKDCLTGHYMVSEKKADLSIDIAKREKALLTKLDYQNGYSLYIGIPFCPTTCLYCSFSSSPLEVWKNRVDEYLDALICEMRAAAALFAGKKLDSIYFGGGTPTTLEPVQLERLLEALHENFPTDRALEFTVEAGRPDSITKEKLQVLKRQQVGRISINPQTMKQETLDLIGRRHTVEQVIESYELARECGFDNINMDLIVGLPGETKADVEQTLKCVEAMAPDSLTVHSLAVKRAAALKLWKQKNVSNQMENAGEVIEMSAAYAKEMGLLPYYLYRQKDTAGNLENVGYARPGFECLYNILIIEEKQTILALGAGGSTKVVFPEENRIERVENVKDVRNYIERVDEMIDRKRAMFCR